MNGISAKRSRVPARLVLASIVGLWLTYFLLTTLRGTLLGYELNWALVSRRLVVTLGSMGVTAALWALFVLLARWPLWLRVGLMMLVALPASLLLTMVNDWVFADVDNGAGQHEQWQGMKVIDDGAGNVVEIGKGGVNIRSKDGSTVEIGNGKFVVREGHDKVSHTNPQPPSAAGPPSSPPAQGSSPAVGIQPPTKAMGFWEEHADMVLGRYFVLIAWMALYLALENAQQARRAERREGEYRRAAQAAELRSLRHQINPHFLFNTLNSLSALVLTGKPAAAEQMIQTLSSFYRRSLAGDLTGDLPLAEEIDLQRLYLEIEAVRFPERLRAVIDMPAALADVMVPGMILQPLVENSIKYAVAASSRPVVVAIVARAKGGWLVLSVSDDGPGAASPDGCGIGLANVRDRLHARFDGAASLDFGTRPEGGFQTIIHLPLQRRHG
jgi:hypothetical protein